MWELHRRAKPSFTEVDLALASASEALVVVLAASIGASEASTASIEALVEVALIEALAEAALDTAATDQSTAVTVQFTAAGSTASVAVSEEAAATKGVLA